jgi:hypothetical protein
MAYNKLDKKFRRVIFYLVLLFHYLKTYGLGLASGALIFWILAKRTTP